MPADSERTPVKRRRAMVISKALFPHLNNLFRLRERMVKVGFVFHYTRSRRPVE